MADYWELKEMVARLVPRQIALMPMSGSLALRPGRKLSPDYKRFDLVSQTWMGLPRRTLPMTDIGSSIEVSCKASGCPAPLNVDVWDGRVCAYSCTYCFANYFRRTLYDNFFDGVGDGARHVDIDRFIEVFKAMLNKRRESPDTQSPVERALAQGIPVRIGVRYENFLPVEAKHGVTKRVLRLLADVGYPVIIDTKSDLLARDDYLELLAANKGGAVVQFSCISVDGGLLRELEPGAPSPERRFAAMRCLTEHGIRAVARIEPFLPFLTDMPQTVADYIAHCREAGVQHITWDNFSFSTANESTRRLFMAAGIDFDRLLLAGAESRLVSSLLLGRMMMYFRSEGIKCSTYDDPNAIDNDDVICCNTTGALKQGRNLGSSKCAIDYIVKRTPRSVGWSEYGRYVGRMGGFMSPEIRMGLKKLWNDAGDEAYGMSWSGLQRAGDDMDGARWAWTGRNLILDYAQEAIRNLNADTH